MYKKQDARKTIYGIVKCIDDQLRYEHDVLNLISSLWNVYLDTPPTENYLYCNVEEVNGMPHIQFYIQQGSIDNETFRLIKNTMDNDGQKMFQVYEMACGRFIVKLKNKVVVYVRKNGTIKNLEECFHAIKTDIEDYFVPNSCEDVVKRALIVSPVFQKCVEDELKNLGVAYNK